MTEQLRFDNEVAIITGAGAGLGRTYALEFAKRGAKVVVNDLGGDVRGDGKSSSAADAVVAEIKAAGGEAVANHDSVENGAAIVQTALDAFGTVDIVINNAGILRDVSFQKMSEQDWDLIYRVHLLGAMRVTQAAWPILRDKGYGRIVMTASAAGLYGNFGQANYSAAKLALVGLGQTLAEEGRSKNIHVNVIAPAAASRLLSSVLSEDVMSQLKPEYVSPLVAWLCHETCQETKGVFEVGAGFIGKLRWERTQGAFLAGPRGMQMEDVAAHWNSIVDFSHTTHPQTPAESFTSILEQASTPRLGGNEFIDLDELSKDTLEAESSYDERDLALYALGVGAARDATDRTELPYVYELGDGFQAVPSYAVMPALNTFLNLAREDRALKGMNFGLDRVLHGEQYTELLRPLPPKARLKHTYRLKAAYDKAPNALLILAADTFDESGEKLAYNEITLFIRGAGGWGGERGPSTDVNAPPAREPDAVIEEKTDDNQALLYRLSGDWNPLHADPDFAKAFGFDKPILHGLCAYGFATRHVVKAIAGNDSRRFKSIKVRFVDSIFPGETLVTRIWKESAGRVVFETRIKERDKLALSHAAVEFYDQIPQIAAKPAALAATANAAAPSRPVVSATPTTADVFQVIEKHFVANKGLGDQVKTLFQFKIKDPDSEWVVDLKSGDGKVQSGTVPNPDATLELSDADWLAMSTGQVDPTKLYFSGKLKITGNIMAAQKLAFLQKIDPNIMQDVLAARAKAADAVAGPAEPTSVTPAQPATPTTADVFQVIEKHFAANKGLGDQVKTLFQFKIKDPDSDWVIDLKSGDGKVQSGTVPNPDATLELSDADWLAMSTGQVDPTKLYFSGKLKIAGNIMATQKLTFLQKIDPKFMQEVLAARLPAAVEAPAAQTATANAASSATTAQAPALFKALAERLGNDANALPSLANRVVQFHIREPDADWVIDLRDAGKPQITPARVADADAVFALTDADLAALAQGQAQARDLFQRGRLRVDGATELAHALEHLPGLLSPASSAKLAKSA